MMDWMKKHVDTVIILGAFASSLLWMNGRFGDIERRFADLEKETAIIKTVLIMRNVMPAELAVNQKEVEK